MRTLFLYSCDGGPNDGEPRATTVDHPDNLDPCSKGDLEAHFFPALDHPNLCGMFVVPLGDDTPAPQVSDEEGDEVFQLYADLR